jgi:hypothetical protein
MFYKELWPLTQSYELVYGNINDIANAVFNVNSLVMLTTKIKGVYHESER